MTNDHRFVDPRGRSDGCGGGFRPAGFATNCAARKAAHLCNGACSGVMRGILRFSAPNDSYAPERIAKSHA